MSFHQTNTLFLAASIVAGLGALGACKPQPAEPPKAAATVPTDAEAAAIVDRVE